MHINIENTVLRPWMEADAERLAVLANNKKIFDNLRDGFPYPYTKNDILQDSCIYAILKDDFS